ncbi:MAG: carbamoyltransferase [Candidatus Zhuqueibacterota bacterium]
MYILGISAYYHDSAACLVKDGEILAAAQEERFTRKKHDFNFPACAIEYCLNSEKITASDLEYVAFYDKPFVKFERLLESYLTYAPKGIRSFIKAMPIWLKQKLWTKELLKNDLGYEGPVIFPEHHQSHAASAFFPSPFQNAAFLTIDGVGEWNTTTFGFGEGNRIEILAELNFPHSLGLLYSAFTYFTGFKVNSGEYKLMGLAPYGEPKYVDTILNELIDLKQDGSFKMNMDYFNYCVGLTMTSPKMNALFDGPPRKSESQITRREMDIARSIQDVTEEIMLRMSRHVHASTGKKKLVLAGGTALNCVANGRILREGPFEDIWIQPAAGDAGGAIGAALFTWYQYLENERNVNDMHDLQKSSYLGPEFSEEEIATFLNEQHIPHTRISSEEIPGAVAQLINAEKVVGWFQGRMEFGPRALGSRSIIGDARSRNMQSTMNLKIKYRESFRPFAPSVLSEHVSDYFEIDRESPYMLLVAPVREEKRILPQASASHLFGIEKLKVPRSVIPAVTHVDYSARIQTVDAKNGLYYDMIKAFYDITKCPVIINTSFNVRGEPIVCNPQDAYTCFMRTEMDYLMLGNFLLDKEKQPALQEEKDWRAEFELD